MTNTYPPSPLLSGLAGFAALALSMGAATAGRVFVNSTEHTPGTGTTAAGFKFRASPADWDCSLGNQISTFNSANFLAANPANRFDGNGCTVQFTIENRPGEGMVLTTGGTPGTRAITARLAWGTFSPSVNATSQAASLNGAVPGTPFDTLTLEAQSRVSGSALRLRNLAFAAPGMTVTGNLIEADIAAHGTSTNHQHIVSDTNLATVAWTLTGEVCLRRQKDDTQSFSADELVRLLVTAKQGGRLRDPAPQLDPTLAPVPEPAAATLSAAALAGLWLRRRRS